MIIDDLDILRTRRLVRPLETDSPLIINANAVLPFSIASKCFETITRQCRKIPEHACCLQTVQLQTRGTFDTRKCFYALACGEMFSPDRKSTRLNSSHVAISYAVFCLKKKTKIEKVLIAWLLCRLLIHLSLTA